MLFASEKMVVVVVALVVRGACVSPVTRRQVLLTSSSSLVVGQSAVASSEKKSLLVRRSELAVRDLRKPEFGVEYADICYPAIFEGSWSAVSTAVDLSAPVGVPLFGGEKAFEAAKDELGEALSYDVRFFRRSDAIVADRPLNTRNLVAATLGDRGKVTSLPSSQNFNANDLKFNIDLGTASYAASLRTVARYFDGRENDDKAFFQTSELVRQAITTNNNMLALPSIKDIETICLYDRIDQNTITCDQRTATWLFPSDQALAVQVAAAAGRPIDVRRYRVVYHRKPPR